MAVTSETIGKHDLQNKVKGEHAVKDRQCHRSLIIVIRLLGIAASALVTRIT
jgi:hypothetical protein